MKPNWKDAPRWANYLAQDNDGRWAWYEEEPLMQSTIWRPITGRAEYAETDYPWQNSLESRPCPENIDSDYIEQVSEKDEGTYQEIVERRQLMRRLALSTGGPQ